MDIFSICILLLAGLFLWWVVKERGRNERERQVSIELANRMFRLDERLLKLETVVDQLQSAASRAASPLSPALETNLQQIPADPETTSPPGRELLSGSSQAPGYPAAPATSTLTITPDDVSKKKDSTPETALPPTPTGSTLPANPKESETSRLANAGLRKLPTPTPKLDEMGMAAVLFGLAFLMQDDQHPKNKPD